MRGPAQAELRIDHFPAQRLPSVLGYLNFGVFTQQCSGEGGCAATSSPVRRSLFATPRLKASNHATDGGSGGSRPWFCCCCCWCCCWGPPSKWRYGDDPPGGRWGWGPTGGGGGGARRRRKARAQGSSGACRTRTPSRTSRPRERERESESERESDMRPPPAGPRPRAADGARRRRPWDPFPSGPRDGKSPTPPRRRPPAAAAATEPEEKKKQRQMKIETAWRSRSLFKHAVRIRFRSIQMPAQSDFDPSWRSESDFDPSWRSESVAPSDLSRIRFRSFRMPIFQNQIPIRPDTRPVLRPGRFFRGPRRSPRPLVF